MKARVQPHRLAIELSIFLDTRFAFRGGRSSAYGKTRLTDGPPTSEEGMTMSESSRDAGVIQVLLERLETQRLPRALDLKKKVDQGEPLDDYDINYLEQVFADAQKIQPYLVRHPEYEKLVSRVIHLYKEITDKAMENEKKRPK